MQCCLSESLRGALHRRVLGAPGRELFHEAALMALQRLEVCHQLTANGWTLCVDHCVIEGAFLLVAFLHLLAIHCLVFRGGVARRWRHRQHSPHFDLLGFVQVLAAICSGFWAAQRKSVLARADRRTGSNVEA